LVCTWAVVFIGCETADKGAKELGKPMGKMMKTSEAISQGATEGLGTDKQSNPFNR